MSKVEWKGIAAGILLLLAGGIGVALKNEALVILGLFGVVVLVFFIVDAYRKRNKYDPQRKMKEEEVVVADVFKEQGVPPWKGQARC